MIENGRSVVGGRHGTAGERGGQHTKLSNTFNATKNKETLSKAYHSTHSNIRVIRWNTIDSFSLPHNSYFPPHNREVHVKGRQIFLSLLLICLKEEIPCFAKSGGCMAIIRVEPHLKQGRFRPLKFCNNQTSSCLR